MNAQAYERAKRYALRRLERELPPVLTYHCLQHTRDDVVPAAGRLAALEGVEGEPLLLLLTAAYYHDIGFVERCTDHEAIGVQIAAKVLSHFGFSSAEIEVISGIIMATRLPQSPSTLLEEIMVDADLDVLGRDDFWPLNRALRAEMAALGQSMTDEEWYRSQVEFVQTHRYFTAAARTLRDQGKRRNLEELSAVLEECRARIGNAGPALDRVPHLW
jgi:uncharacterized protein